MALRKGFSLELMGLSQDSKDYHSKVNRASKIRSSEWSSIWGLNPYLSRAKYWHILKGKREREEVSPYLPAILHGHTEEPISYKIFERDYLDPNLRIQTFGARQYWEDPIFSASPDGLICDEKGKLVAGLEIKNPHTRDIPKEVSPDTYEELSYRALQCFLCCAIFEVPYWFLFYTKNKTRESALFKVHFNGELWNQLRGEAKTFLYRTHPPEERVKTKEKKIQAKRMVEGMRVELIEYRPPISEED
jgi:hypothetical protein